MADILQQVIDDLQAEHDSLESVLSRIPFAAWEKETYAPGWAIRDQVAHLAYFDEAAMTAIADPERFAAESKQLNLTATGGEPRYLVEARTRPAPEVFDWWQRARHELIERARGLDPARRMPWYGPPMSGVSFVTARLMEAWSHGLDVVDAAGTERAETERLRHIAHLGVRTRNFSYVNRGMEPNETPVRVELLSPAGDTWVFGEAAGPDVIKGPALDFCQVVTQRRHVADTGLEVTGAAAEEWMLVAQAFAGPPGRGRQPGQFAKRGA